MAKHYDQAFKKVLTEQYISGERSAKSLSHEFGLHENTIYKWAEQYRIDPLNAFPGSGNQKPNEDDLRRAQKRIREPEEENAILKQAAAYFAKHSR